jgi:hypothetical protein
MYETNIKPKFRDRKSKNTFSWDIAVWKSFLICNVTDISHLNYLHIRQVSFKF